MKSFKIAVVAAACAVAVSTAAFASSGWEGPYAGISVGGGFADGAITDRDCYTCGTDDFTEAFAQAGLTAGYNHLVNPDTLVGVEAEATYGGQDHRGIQGGDDGAADEQSGTSKVDWTLALLARAGLVTGDNLFFVEAGPALANLEAKSVSFDGANSWDANTWAPAFKGGIGTEWMIGNGLSARAQYSILDVQNVTTEGTGDNCAGDCAQSWTTTQQTVTIGLSKHF